MRRPGDHASAFPVHEIDADTPAAPLFLIVPIAESGLGSPAVPHRHEFAEIAYVTAGTGTHYIDFDGFTVKAPQVFVIAPGQVHSWETEGLEGVLVLFRDDFLAGPGGIDLLDAGFAVDSVLRPSPEQLIRFDRVLAEIEAEFHGPQDAQALRSLLTVLLLHCRRMATQPSNAQVHGVGREFLRYVATNASAKLTVGQCAARVGVSPGYLYEAVLAQTGRTPGDVIRTTTLREAQRLLARTELSCRQIATRLGFDDASYFSRFFRREAGTTPSMFRQRFLVLEQDPDEHHVKALHAPV